MIVFAVSKHVCI